MDEGQCVADLMSLVNCIGHFFFNHFFLLVRSEAWRRRDGDGGVWARGRSRRRLAALSNRNAAGLVHSSRFSFKSSNLRRDPKLWGAQLPRWPELGEICNQDRLSR